MRSKYERDVRRYLRHLKRSNQKLRWRLGTPELGGYKRVMEFRKGLETMAAEIANKRIIERGI